MKPTDSEIIQAMRVYGGGFVVALAGAFSHADSENFARLKAAFPEIWQQYADFVPTMQRMEACAK